jgi:hypothetical protein
VVAHTLNIDLELISVKPSNNLTAPNGMVSGGSLASEACAYVSIELCDSFVHKYNASVINTTFCFVYKFLLISTPSKRKNVSFSLHRQIIITPG